MDLSKIKDVKDLQGLLELLLQQMGKHDLAELEITDAGRTIRLSKKVAPIAAVEMVPVASAFAPLRRGEDGAAADNGSAAASAAGASEELPANIREVTSPMVGSFYRAPSPEAEPFIQEGDRVQSDSVVCIIEAMKVMNEIPAPIAGIVREILVKNGESVEYGQPLFRIEVE